MTVTENDMLKYIQTKLSCNTTDHSYNSMLRVEEFNRSRCNVSLSFVDPGMMSLRVLYIQAKRFSEGGFNIKMPSYHNGNYHYKDKLVLWSHYLNNENPYLDRWALYWSTCILSVWPESQAPQVPVPEDRGPRLQACGTWMGTIWLSEGVGGRGNCRRLTAGMECVIVWEATTCMECVIVWEATTCMECVIVWEATICMECVIVWEATYRHGVCDCMRGNYMYGVCDCMQGKYRQGVCDCMRGNCRHGVWLYERQLYAWSVWLYARQLQAWSVWLYERQLQAWSVWLYERQLQAWSVWLYEATASMGYHIIWGASIGTEWFYQRQL